MTREVHQIPAAPRRSIRWSKVLWHRWPFAMLGFLFAVYGGLVSMMLTFHAGGKPSDDAILNIEPTIAEGRILEVQPTRARLPSGNDAVRAHYEFDHGGAKTFGKCFAEPGLAPGDAVTVEFSAEKPEINRIVGGRLYLLADWAGIARWITIVPGALFWALWILGVVRMRRLLVHGDVAVANILSIDPVAVVVPSMLDVKFSFLDRHAKAVEGRHWVRERAPLGERLLANRRPLAVVHDRHNPHRNRLVIPEEFAAS